MRFGFETGIWGRRIEDLELVLDTISACGFAGVEFAQSPSEIYLQDSNSANGKRGFSNVAELLPILGARKLVLIGLSGGSLEERMKFCADYRDCYLYVEDLGRIEKAALAQSRPFQLALHPHWFMKVQRVNQARKKLLEYRQEFPNGNDFRLLLDTAHLTIVDDDPAVAVRMFFDSLAAVHLMDWKPDYGRYSHRYSQGFVSLGKGIVKLREVLQSLDEKKYPGWVVVEQDLTNSSPAQNAFDCAEWLHQGKWVPAPDPHLKKAILHRENAAVAPRRQPDELQRQAQFLEKVIPATVRGAAYFYQTTVTALRELYGLEAVKLYSYYPPNEELYLLAMDGAEICTNPKNVLMANECLSREVIRSQKSQEFDLTLEANRKWFQDSEFLKALRGSKMITIPIFNPSNTRHLRYLLNIFPVDGSPAVSQEELERLGMAISRLADHVADDICSAASTRTSIACSGVKTLRDLLARLKDLILETFGCEAVSIFLVDETGERLVVDETVATTGIVWRNDRIENGRFYQKGEGLTGHTWDSRELILATDVKRAEGYHGVSHEKRRSQEREEVIFTPLARAGGDVFGVIRIVNKIRPPNPRAATMFTDEDGAEIDSIIQAAIPHLQLLTIQERQSDAIQRMTHEFQVPMVAIRAAADRMNSIFRSKQLDSKEFFGRDLLGDVMSWALLMGRLANNAKLFAAQPGATTTRPTRTFLLRDVVAPAVNHVRLLLDEKRFRHTEIHCGDFAEIPPLMIDRNLFQQVFFNLLSNAIKYAGKDSLRVRVEGGAQGLRYFIWFSDWGIGVPSSLRESIFLPGFRAQAARDSDVAGQGIGLYVVRNIIRAHKGDIKLTGCSDPTRFEISLPQNLRFSNWAEPV
jgi:signal transduction histidine kinase/sugar phosphate isomerase/epimerase